MLVLRGFDVLVREEAKTDLRQCREEAGETVLGQAEGYRGCERAPCLLRDLRTLMRISCARIHLDLGSYLGIGDLAGPDCLGRWPWSRSNPAEELGLLRVGLVAIRPVVGSSDAEPGPG